MSTTQVRRRPRLFFLPDMKSRFSFDLKPFLKRISCQLSCRNVANQPFQNWPLFICKAFHLFWWVNRKIRALSNIFFQYEWNQKILIVIKKSCSVKFKGIYLKVEYFTNIFRITFLRKLLQFLRLLCGDFIVW